MGSQAQTVICSLSQSNGRAEVSVKAVKWIIHNNILPDGKLDNDKAEYRILQYQNTPLPDVSLSLAQVLLHHQLTDSIPAHPAHYRPHKEWILTAKEREKLLSKWNHILVQKNDAEAHELIPLTLGTNAVVQSKGKKWDRARHIVETIPNRQYHVHTFYSGRVTLYSHCSPRKYTAITPGAHQPVPSTSLSGSTLPAATKCDTLNVAPGPPYCLTSSQASLSPPPPPPPPPSRKVAVRS